MSPSPLAGRLVVVVGGSSGIGLACAQAVAERGARVLIASRSRERLQAARARIPGDVQVEACDITMPEEVDDFARRLDRLDHLIVTASGAASGNFLEVDMATVRRFWDSKFWGPYQVAKALAPRIARDGSITFYSGAAARRASPGFSFGSALNAAVEALSNSLAIELAPVRVNTVSPGIIDTPIWNTFLDVAARAEVFTSAAARTPAHRIGTPEDVAPAVLFLLENAFVTGSVVTVDGGYVHA